MIADERARELLRAAFDLFSDEPLIDPVETASSPSRPRDRIDFAEKLYNLRSARAETFGHDLFGEPAWDILLDLFIQKGRGRRVSVTSACIASNVPATTALRWISILGDRGLIEKRNDPEDKRRTFLEISERGLREMTHFLTNLSSSRESDNGRP
ncbi:winged helix DNA-binding protein [uncultured Novosphingobium sp.]|uniref:winged helix DNA-binding protein n=1 Tax=uncultured Novosphingobium sp. TaxID=292277 RepID=UPI00374A08A0